MGFAAKSRNLFAVIGIGLGVSLGACSDEEEAQPADQATELPEPPAASASVDMPDCDGYDFATPFLQAYNSAQPYSGSPEGLEIMTTLEAAECQQDRLIAMLTEQRGPRIGFKVGLASKAAQDQFGVPAPIVGQLFDGMMLANGAAISMAAGAVMAYELDLLVRVGSDDISTATTINEVAEYIEEVIPYIEVPDLMIPPGAAFSGALVVAMNVAPRLGVIGDPIPFTATPEWIDALGSMKATMIDNRGVTVEGTGADLGGHPLNMALFLIGEAERRGWEIKKGDLISLGSFGNLQITQRGVQVRALYEGLPGGPVEVGLGFE